MPSIRTDLFAVALLLALCSVTIQSATADPWQNLRLNTDDTSELQNEEQIAINPTDPNNMVAVWRDFRLGFRQVGWAYTFDGGSTWTEGGLLVEPIYTRDSDPGVTVDKDGNFYVVILSFESTAEPNGLFVLRSSDGGVSWHDAEDLRRVCEPKDKKDGAAEGQVRRRQLPAELAAERTCTFKVWGQDGIDNPDHSG